MGIFFTNFDGTSLEQGGESRAVTPENIEEYKQSLSTFYLKEAVATQLRHFSEGYFLGCETSGHQFLNPEELRIITSGPDVINVPALEQVVKSQTSILVFFQ